MSDSTMEENLRKCRSTGMALNIVEELMQLGVPVFKLQSNDRQFLED
jgi:hypothetical protein